MTRSTMIAVALVALLAGRASTQTMKACNSKAVSNTAQAKACDDPAATNSAKATVLGTVYLAQGKVNYEMDSALIRAAAERATTNTVVHMAQARVNLELANTLHREVDAQMKTANDPLSRVMVPLSKNELRQLMSIDANLTNWDRWNFIHGYEYPMSDCRMSAATFTQLVAVTEWRMNRYYCRTPNGKWSELVVRLLMNGVDSSVKMNTYDAVLNDFEYARDVNPGFRPLVQGWLSTNQTVIPSVYKTVPEGGK